MCLKNYKHTKAWERKYHFLKYKIKNEVIIKQQPTLLFIKYIWTFEHVIWIYHLKNINFVNEWERLLLVNEMDFMCEVACK